MSLKLSDYGIWVQGGSPIDYLEVRNGEQYAINFTITDQTGSPIDITGWTFSTSSTIYTATFSYDGSGALSKITNFVSQTSTTNPSGLTAFASDAPNGIGMLLIPASVNPNPSTLVTADTDNTLLNIIQITATYPSDFGGFSNIRKLMIGLIVRFGA